MKHPTFHPNEEARVGPAAYDRRMIGRVCRIESIKAPIEGRMALSGEHAERYVIHLAGEHAEEAVRAWGLARHGVYLLAAAGGAMSEQKPGWGYNNEFRVTRTTVTYEYLWDECQRVIDKAATENPGASVVLISARNGKSIGGQMPAEWSGQRVTVTI